MLMARTFSVLALSVALSTLVGCVGPNAHGPIGGCCGPIAISNGNACTGCGELYVDPWINHPADCVDPCDMCGNYNGQSCGKCRPMFDGIRSLWGYRCGAEACGCDTGSCDGGCVVSTGGYLGGGCGVEGCGVESCDGCNSCGFEGGDVVYEGDVVHEGEVYLSDPGTSGGYVGGVPTPARDITDVAPADQPYKPERKRKIFNPRPRVATGDGRSVGY